MMKKFLLILLISVLPAIMVLWFTLGIMIVGLAEVRN